MTVEVKVPTLPESVADGTLVNWKKKPGDPVTRGENLVDLETDKVVLDIPAPADGVLGPILRQEGDTVSTGDVIRDAGRKRGRRNHRSGSSGNSSARA
ncbi:MAG: dihydrolipoamide succinyltransferase, partial [Synechococcaceae cyanobacterium SM1_2_3]|nr:dihydrolipoamide succinyltransferase [Synechococcaceae cyanobacterium SM1_2_3]